MNHSPVRLKNHKLAALHPDEMAGLRPDFERVEMPLGQVLYESGVQLKHVYFLETFTVSLL
ncbi:MAG: hypothetical protein ACJARU_001884 [Congregibacter sp.]|jgi:hypothetical protein